MRIPVATANRLSGKSVVLFLVMGRGWRKLEHPAVFFGVVICVVVQVQAAIDFFNVALDSARVDMDAESLIGRFNEIDGGAEAIEGEQLQCSQLADGLAGIGIGHTQFLLSQAKVIYAGACTGQRIEQNSQEKIVL